MEYVEGCNFFFFGFGLEIVFVFYVDLGFDFGDVNLFICMVGFLVFNFFVDFFV